MSGRHVVGALALVAATFLAARAVYSEDAAKSGGGAPSEEEMIKAMAARAAPVEEHAKLSALAGTWDAEVTCADAGVERKSKATLTSESVLGGRVLLSRFKGEMCGHPYEGVELRGFDKEKKRHWSVWCDSMGTSYMRLAGERDASGNVALTSDEFDCMGVKYVGHAVARTVDADHYDFEMVCTAPGQPESRMTIRYARRK